MRRSSAVLAACLAAGMALALSAPTTAAVVGDPPFRAPQVATADSGEAVVLWNAPQGLRAAIGTPGGGYGAPVTITPSGGDSAVVMDAAGNAVIVWEEGRTATCNRVPCGTSSLGVFAAIRPAGGQFGAPVLLTPGQGYLAQPQVVMNRAGDWIVTMGVGGRTVVGMGTGATPPRTFAELPPLRMRAGALAIDEAGNTTLGGTDAENRPATLIRRADGSFGPLTVLDDASLLLGSFITIGVGSQGHAVAVWPGGGFLRSAARLPDGSFGAPVTSGVAAGSPPESIGVDGQGRTVMVLQPTPVFPARFELQVRRGTVAAPFGEPERLTAADRDIGGPTRFAMASGGNAVLGWLQTDRFRDPAAQVAIAGDAGPFSNPLVLARGTGGYIDIPDVAIDGSGRAALAWSSVSGNVQRILAASLTPTAAAGPTVVTQAPLVVPTLAQGMARPAARQILRIRADGTVRPKLTCTGATCSGTLRIDVRPAPGRKLVRLGTHRFLFVAGRSQPVTVRVTRAARRAAGRRSLKGKITVHTARAGGGRALEAVTAVTVRRTRR